MNRKRWVAVISVAGVAVAMSGCEPKGEVEKLRQEIQAYTKGGDPNNLNGWLTFLAHAVCQLEANNTSGLDPNKRICKTGPGDIKPPPTYP